MSASGKKRCVRVAISIPEAGRKLGIGRNQAYEAAHRGKIPTIKLGRRRVVPLMALNRKLRGE
jgi:excisionase family DNA binding protein